mmetsp:Transcript_11613/g.11253  ORF Transcript_11613/g.11253 Transcript_11613/m.11253 type:complete len:201 (+) Transcript_11613:20-622(+)
MVILHSSEKRAALMNCPSSSSPPPFLGPSLSLRPGPGLSGLLTGSVVPRSVSALPGSVSALPGSALPGLTRPHTGPGTRDRNLKSEFLPTMLKTVSESNISVNNKVLIPDPNSKSESNSPTKHNLPLGYLPEDSLSSHDMLPLPHHGIKSAMEDEDSLGEPRRTASFDFSMISKTKLVLSRSNVRPKSSSAVGKKARPLV